MALLCVETFSGVEEFLIHSVQFLTLSTPISLTYTHTHTQSWFSEDKPWLFTGFPELENGRNLFVVCKQEPEFGLALVISKAGQAGKRILEAE